MLSKSKSRRKHTGGSKIQSLNQHSGADKLDGVRSQTRDSVPALTEGADRSSHKWDLLVQSERYSEDRYKKAVTSRRVIPRSGSPSTKNSDQRPNNGTGYVWKARSDQAGVTYTSSRDGIARAKFTPNPENAIAHKWR